MLFNAFRHGMLNIMVFVKRTLSMNMIRSHMLAIRIPLSRHYRIPYRVKKENYSPLILVFGSMLAILSKG